MANFHVPLKKTVDDSYDIQIGRNLFDDLVNDLKNGLTPKASRYALITDSNIEKLYANDLYKKLTAAGFQVDMFVMPAGEKYKTRQTKADLEDQMLDKGFGRDSAVIALGGGVVSDLAGYLAGTFGRGVPFINYSTTLLSAADASVGGKTAVDTPHATNLIGLFNQPAKVYLDIETWNTLPAREIRSGLAETVKHACLADYELFEWLEANITRICEGENARLEADACEHIAFKNCEIKYTVVQKDEKESNLRMVLNLGHTAGRAFEALCGYTYTHGECVAIGIVVQAFIAEDLGHMSSEEKDRIIGLLKSAGLPVSIPEGTSLEELVVKMRTDKKARKGQTRFVIQDGIGKMKTFEGGSYSIPLDEDYILSILEKMDAYFS
ncbi:MAG: 3-dehydroquinate synthase [Lentisphaeraceae bacterium]|nr:3-dehydroquinate synthase [Lentisphaeraceae bacterium]